MSVFTRLSRGPDEAVEGPGVGEGDEAQPRGAVRKAAAGATTVLAGLLVWFALVAPDDLGRLSPGAFVGIPLEGLVFVGAVLVLPARVRRIVAAVVGVGLAFGSRQVP